MELWDDCMSLPWLLCRVVRSRSISIEFTDGEGRRQEWSTLDAAVSELLQHELDHLDGILITDRAEELMNSSSRIKDTSRQDFIISREVYDQEHEYFDNQVDYKITPTL
jgi:peptide deformylase